MDGKALSGIAAHWLYKSGGGGYAAPLRTRQWLENLVELQKKSSDSLEFIEHVKVDLFPEEVYVFTPKGDILELPLGATVIDFAYAVHSDLGNRCYAVKIDRQFRPLSTCLENGQTIEVMTDVRRTPNPAWLDIVLTSKARSAIRHFLKLNKKAQSVALGQKLLNAALTPFRVQYAQISDQVLEALTKEIHVADFTVVLEQIGLGNRVAKLTAQRIYQLSILNGSEIKNSELENPEPLTIQGTEGIILEYAPCCLPMPGDMILGIQSAGFGIQVHVNGCPKIAKLQRKPESIMLLRWASGIKQLFKARLEIEVVNCKGLLASLAATIDNCGVGIDDVDLYKIDRQHLKLQFMLLVRSKKDYLAVQDELLHHPNVQRCLPRFN